MMNRLLSVLILGLVSLHLTAQTYTTKENAKGKAKKFYERGMEYSRNGNDQKAAKDFEAALREAPDFIDAQLYLAGSLANLKMMSEAEEAFERALAIDSTYSAKALFSLASIEQQLEKYHEAAIHYQQYIDHPDAREILLKRAQQRLAVCRFTADALRNAVPYEPKTLGEKINTPDPEYLPSLTAEGNTMIYTRVVRGQEDFYISTKKDNVWQEGQPLSALNTPMNEGAQNIAADGKSLVFTACSRKDGLGSCDLYYSEIRDGRWTPPANMGSPINTMGWESQPSLSADGRTLYFTSKRSGGLGGADIWVSHRESNGKWSVPENLGDRINTPNDDQSPFIHADGQTLYFMSSGHPGMGGFDLYLSRKQEDGSWGEAKNLGYPINTKGNEGALIISLDGTTAYFATGPADNSSGGKASLMDKMQRMRDQDLFSFTLHEEIRPKPVTYVKAIVFESGTKTKLSAQVEFIDLSREKLHASSYTDENGEFLVCLPLGKDYALNVSKKGYLFHSENFSLSTVSKLEKPFLMEIELQPIPQTAEDSPVEMPADALTSAKPIILKNVFFDTGSSNLRSSSFIELNRLRDLLEENPRLRIQINGHTDNVGSDQDNLKLSNDRAKAVYDYLVQKGINGERLQFKGFGESRPLAGNETAEGRQQNRRTEFVVLP